MRDKYWDIIKALGIIAVVLGHIGILGYFVSLYHLVLFFFVAGYFYNEKYSTNLFNFFAKKLERLWWPTFKYTCFFTIFHNVFWTLYLIHGKVFENYLPGEYVGKYEILKNIVYTFLGSHIESIGGPIWFVAPLFFTLILFSIIRNIAIKCHGKITSFVCSFLVIGVYLLGFLLVRKHISLPYMIEISLIVMPIIYVGFLLNSKKYIDKIIPNNKYILFALFVVCVVILQSSLKKGIIILLSDRKFYNPLVFLAISFVGIYMNLVLGKLINKLNFLRNIFAYIGKNSFHIMALHFFSFKLMNLVIIIVMGLSYSEMPRVVIDVQYWYLYLLTGIGVPLGLNYLYDKIKSGMVRQKL